MNDTKQKPAKKSHKKAEIDEFKVWLAGLGMPTAPWLHVNGTSYAGAVLTVDLGTPLEEHKLTNEQSAELVARMKTATRSLYKHEVNIRVQNDSTNGIFWSSVN
jgi:hypothetical protein